MAIYAKTVKEAAVKDTIQTPDDIGVDLDQIEKNIAGKDGIEAHRDEIEDAELGLIDDAELAESAAMIMYESQYNMNQLFECLAIHELNAASIGRELVLEEADTEGFIDKTVRIIKEAAEKFARWFAEVFTKIVNIFNDNKKFAEKNDFAIKEGYRRIAADSDAKGTKFNDDYISDLVKKIGGFSAIDIKKLHDDMGADANAKAEDYSKKVYKDILGIDVSSSKDLRAKIIEGAMSKEPVGIKEVYPHHDDLINALKNDTPAEIKKVYNDAKKSVDGIIKDMKRDASNYNDKNNKEKLKSIAKVAVEWQNTIQGAAMTLASIRSKEASQARRFAMKCAGAGAGAELKHDKSIPEVFDDHIGESSTVSSNDVFGSITLL